jgi:poly-gamma-glutamate synthesis protein (capsule biosynthesis protein)
VTLRRNAAGLASIVATLALACAGSRPAAPGPERDTPQQGAAQPVPVSPTSGAAAPASPRGAVAARPAEEPAVVTVARVSIGAVGDVLMHGAVKDAASDHRAPGNDEGFGWLWAPVADLLAGTDVTFANLETPVAPRAGRGSRSFVFNAPPAVVTALRRAGVGVVSVANNHIFDQGRPGFEETLKQLDALGMAYVGAGPAGREAGPRVVDVNGMRLAFLGYARFFNQDGNECPPRTAGRGPCVKAALLDGERAVREVRAAAEQADAVVVSVHWGDEYEPQPREADVALARQLIEAGAMLVLGHHPHVLQPIEIVQRRDGTSGLVAYSLGNFVSNQSRHYVHGVTPAAVAATRDGALLRAEIVRRDYGRGISRVELGSASWFPLWTENDTADPARRTSGRRPAIQVVSIDRALAAVRAELRALPDPLPPDQRPRYLALRQREELYRARRSAIAAALGEDLGREAPPAPAVPVAPAAPTAPPAQRLTPAVAR